MIEMAQNLRPVPGREQAFEVYQLFRKGITYE